MLRCCFIARTTGNALGERDSHDGNPIGGLSSNRKRRIRRCRNGRAHWLACSPDLRRPARGVATPRRARNASTFARLPIDAAATRSLWESGRTAATVVTEGVSKLPTFSQWLVELVPTNPIRAAADGSMFPLVIFVLLFALASTPHQSRRSTTVGSLLPGCQRDNAGAGSLDHCCRSLRRVCVDARIHRAHGCVSIGRTSATMCSPSVLFYWLRLCCSYSAGGRRSRFFPRFCVGPCSGANRGIQFSLFARLVAGAHRGRRR